MQFKEDVLRGQYEGEKLSPLLRLCLQILDEMIIGGITITSLIRDRTDNISVHPYGRAADIRCKDMTLEEKTYLELAVRGRQVKDKWVPLHPKLSEYGMRGSIHSPFTENEHIHVQV